MRSHLKNLIADVRAATVGRGSKKNLAASLKIPQSRLSEWLNGRHEPGAEIALRMRFWVEEQRKTRAGAGGKNTRTGKQTQRSTLA